MSLKSRYLLRLSRKRLLWRAFLKRKELQEVSVKRKKITDASTLLCATVRNEMLRLPHFLSHYRRLGVDHFMFVSNCSDDETVEFLSQQSDVSVWHTETGYKASRFGMDWTTWLLRKFGHGKWVLTVDADELLIYPDWETRDLSQLTGWLDKRGRRSFSALMLELYPKGSPDSYQFSAEQDPTEVLHWLDGDGYWSERRGRHNTITILGGVRARCFFQEQPDKAPTLSKLPLVRWHRSYAYLSSTHVLLPPKLNSSLDPSETDMPSGVLLHTKFLPGVGEQAREDKRRRQQYTKWPAHDAYYDALTQAPDMWFEKSVRYTGWAQLLELDLMRRGGW